MKKEKVKRMSIFYEKIFDKQSIGNSEDSPELNGQFKKVIDKLNNVQKQKVINFIELSAVYLSTKAKSQVDTRSENLLLILRRIENSFGRYAIIKNVGHNTKEELKVFFMNIKKYIEIISSYKAINLEDEKVLEELISIIYNLKKFSIQHYFYPTIKKGNLQLFKLVEYLFKNSYIKKQRDFDIIYSSTIFFRTDRKKLKNLAVDYEMTNERVRQLKVSYEKVVLQKLRLLSTISDYMIPFLTNGDIFTLSHIAVSDAFSEKNNKEQKTNFSTYFIAKVISVLAGEQYSEIKNELNIVRQKLGGVGASVNVAETILAI